MTKALKCLIYIIHKVSYPVISLKNQFVIAMNYSDRTACRKHHSVTLSDLLGGQTQAQIQTARDILTDPWNLNCNKRLELPTSSQNTLHSLIAFGVCYWLNLFSIYAPMLTSITWLCLVPNTQAYYYSLHIRNVHYLHGFAHKLISAIWEPSAIFPLVIIFLLLIGFSSPHISFLFSGDLDGLPVTGNFTESC